ncbi:MAG: hypothetical protein ACKVHU_01975 [Acidimicrobiales bacterium]|jgi:hypothetical protein
MGIIGTVALGLVFVLLIYNVGFRMLASFSRSVPEPPPSGELRRVRRSYRCSLCGTEVRMTHAPQQAPEAPRCCMEDMDFVKDHNE